MTLAIYGISSNQELHVENRTEKQKVKKRYHAGGREDQLQNLLGWFISIDNVRESLEKTDWCGKTYPEGGWHHTIGQEPGRNKNEAEES